MVKPAIGAAGTSQVYSRPRRSGGWIAHAESGLVFIKSFADTSPDQLGPDEGKTRFK
jgi:hypothetical protein